MLGDLGADVIKVENPDGGDDTRHWGPPFTKGENGDPGDAAYYLCANRNKRSIAVNMRTEEGQAILRDLAVQSDVVIENYKVGGLAKYGLDYASLSTLNPDLIYCSITGFGQTGPLASQPGYDFLIQAMGGLMSITGDETPMKVGIPAVDLFTGIYASNAIMAALIARDQGQGGQHIDLALFDVQAAMLANQASNYFVSGKVPGRKGNAHPNIVPYQDFPTKDGRLAVAVGNDRQFAAFAHVLGKREWAEDEHYATNEARVENREDLVEAIAAVLQTDTSKDWQNRLTQAGVPNGPIQTLDKVFDHPQTEARGLVEDVALASGATASLVANPVNLSGTPVQTRHAPPRHGQHTSEVLQERLGFDQNLVNDLTNKGVVA